MLEVTEDYIWDGKIKLLQPKNGYRIALDPIILAKTVDIHPKQSILDAGCGVGTISLILKYLNASLNITSIDIDHEIIMLCRKNSQINQLPLDIIEGSIASSILKNRNFDCVVTNPPFYNAHNFRSSAAKKFANFETVDINIWLGACLKRLKSKGNLYIIHLPERIPEILDIVKQQAGKIEITPIYSRPNQDAKRVVIKARKGSRELLKITPPIFLFD